MLDFGDDIVGGRTCTQRRKFWIYMAGNSALDFWANVIYGKDGVDCHKLRINTVSDKLTDFGDDIVCRNIVIDCGDTVSNNAFDCRDNFIGGNINACSLGNRNGG